MLPGIEYLIKKHHVGRGVAQRLRKQADVFWRMGFKPHEITILARDGINNSSTYEVVPLTICQNKGDADASD